jgi:hypothetical protein
MQLLGQYWMQFNTEYFYRGGFLANHNIATTRMEYGTPGPIRTGDPLVRR